MMGRKERAFDPLPPVTLENLVPPDHFYRHLERSLDLSFIRDLVGATYAESGRPSIDPVVFFKLQLILFFELRGLEQVNGEALVIAAGQNLKRLLSWRGWGRRPLPTGAAGVVLPALPCLRSFAP